MSIFATLSSSVNSGSGSGSGSGSDSGSCSISGSNSVSAIRSDSSSSGSSLFCFNSAFLSSGGNHTFFSLLIGSGCSTTCVGANFPTVLSKAALSMMTGTYSFFFFFAFSSSSLSFSCSAKRSFVFILPIFLAGTGLGSFSCWISGDAIVSN